MWTYTTNTVALKAFATPTVESVTALKDGDREIEGKNLLLTNADYNNQLILSHGTLLAEGVEADNQFYPASCVVINGNDTIVKDHHIVLNDEGNAKVRFSEVIAGARSLSVDGLVIPSSANVKIVDYLSRLQGEATVTSAAIVSTDADGKVITEDAKEYKISNASQLVPESRTVLNAASPQYNEAGNWVGILYAVQALASVLWAVVLPRFKSRKFSYFLSLILGGIGFITMGIFTNQYMLFISFILIGCAWAAMLAWPFTILTNSLKGGNIGAYLGLFNCTICLPQIIAALVGGWILSLLSTPGEVAPEYLMMIVAGIAIAIGAFCVFIIKEGKSEPNDMKVQETPAISENI
ncbi:MAG: MFS transporter [Muribaculaceae bacterium]|nr:MFS transporter [Muribaculaceae bacterium]